MPGLGRKKRNDVFMLSDNEGNLSFIRSNKTAETFTWLSCIGVSPVSIHLYMFCSNVIKLLDVRSKCHLINSIIVCDDSVEKNTTSDFICPSKYIGHVSKFMPADVNKKSPGASEKSNRRRFIFIRNRP